MKVDQLQSNKFLNTFTDGALTVMWVRLFQSLMALTAKKEDLTLDVVCGLYNLKL